MWQSVLVAWAVLGGWEVDVQPIQGSAVVGQVTALSGQQIELQTEAGPRTFAAGEVMQIAPRQKTPAAAGKPAWRLLLADGSEVLAGSLSVVRGQVQMKTLGGREAQLSVRSVRWIRSAQMPEELVGGSWQNYVNKEVASDLLVIGKTAKPGAPLSLDFLQGAIRDVSEEFVQLQLEGNATTTPVPRAKVQGMIYAQASGREPPPAACRVIDSSGSQWSASQLSLAGGDLELTLSAGGSLKIPLGEVARLDYSSGKIVYLSDLSAEAVSVEPLIPTLVSQDKGQRLFYLPQKDRFFFGPAELTVGDQKFSKGLALRGQCEAQYRLPGTFRRFQAVAGIQSRELEGGKVRLVISGDKGQLFDGVIAGGAPPLAIDLDVTGTRRLKFTTTYASPQDRSGDFPVLGDARVLK